MEITMCMVTKHALKLPRHVKRMKINKKIRSLYERFLVQEEIDELQGELSPGRGQQMQPNTHGPSLDP